MKKKPVDIDDCTYKEIFAFIEDEDDFCLGKFIELRNLPYRGSMKRTVKGFEHRTYELRLHNHRRRYYGNWKNTNHILGILKNNIGKNVNEVFRYYCAKYKQQNERELFRYWLNLDAVDIENYIGIFSSYDRFYVKNNIIYCIPAKKRKALYKRIFGRIVNKKTCSKRKYNNILQNGKRNLKQKEKNLKIYWEQASRQDFKNHNKLKNGKETN